MKKVIFIPLIALMAACGGGGETKTGETKVTTIKIDGSSTVYPISAAMASEYQKTTESVKIEVAQSGTGGGFKKFARGENIISDASRAIKKAEDSACAAAKIEYIELPVAYDGLAIVVHPENTWATSITVAELKKLWEPAAEGKVKKWSDVRAGWPNQDIHLYGAGTASGTFEYFTEAIVGKSKSSRSDYSSSENDNVLVQGISTDKYALGYFGLFYYIKNQAKLKVVPVDDEKDENGKGPITPSEATVRDASYQPLSRPLYIYINKAAVADSAVDKFVNYYLDNAEAISSKIGYVPLTKEIYALVKARYANRKTGSLFLGMEKTVNVKLDELLGKE